MIKKIAIFIAYILSFAWKSIPFGIRKYIFLTIFVTESRGKNFQGNLRRLLLIKDYLELIINEQALSFGKGTHPKHHLINYKNYFIDRIDDGDTVLDVGCSYGTVSRAIANTFHNSKVIGIDNNQDHINKALSFINPPNLEFIFADATKLSLTAQVDVVIISNILEHIDKRISFLKSLIKSISFKRILIRVPLFERDWQMPLRKDIRINYFSDNDHKIEHTLEQFKDEINKSGLCIKEIQTLWGEIWAVAVIKGNE